MRRLPQSSRRVVMAGKSSSSEQVENGESRIVLLVILGYGHPKYPQRLRSRFPLDTQICGCSSLLYKVT
jgi:hypothetical protein